MTKQEKLRVVIVEPGRYAREAEIDNAIPAEQAAVGGRIDSICLWPEDNVCLIFNNDEGEVIQVEPNRELPEYGNLTFGTFFLCGEKGEDYCSLTDQQVQHYLERFRRPELFVQYKDGMLCIPYDRPDLPDTPAAVKQAYSERHGLPALCFATLRGVDGVLLLQYGERRYLPLGQPPEDLTPARYAEMLNKRIGVSPQQELAMLNGALFGWENGQHTHADQDMMR